MAKLKKLLEDAFQDRPSVNKYEVIEGVKSFQHIGKSIYNNGNVLETAKQLASIAESAHNHILGEQDDWFDKISINKNMKTLKGSVMEFQKSAKEAHMLNQRMTALYEDIGHVLNRYYDISEELDPVGKEDSDVDNDGDTDSSDEYLKKRRAAVSKAIKADESLDHNETIADKPDKEGKSRKNEIDGTPKTKTESKGIGLAGLVDLQAIGGLTKRNK